MLHPKLVAGVDYRINLEIIDVFDKGKNAFIITRINGFTKNSQGVEELAFYIDRTVFVRGLGGFAYKGNGKSKIIAEIPTRKADLVLI
jgi:hypothetical protein